MSAYKKLSKHYKKYLFVFRNVYEHKRHNSEQHLIHSRMVFGGEFWVLTVTDQNRVVTGLHPFKSDFQNPQIPPKISARLRRDLM